MQSLQAAFLNVYKDMAKILNEIIRNHIQVSWGEELIEKTCQVLKFSMRCLDIHFEPFLKELIVLVVNSFKQKSYGSLVYMIEVMCTVFYKFPQCQPLLQEVFNGIVQITVTKLDNIEKMQDNPFLVDDFFGMITRYIKYKPAVILTCPQVKHLLQLALNGIPIKHIKAAEIVFCFIRKAIELAFEKSYEKKIQKSPQAKLAFQGRSALKNLIKNEYGAKFLYSSMHYFLLPISDDRALSDEDVEENVVSVIETFAEQFSGRRGLGVKWISPALD